MCAKKTWFSFERQKNSFLILGKTFPKFPHLGNSRPRSNFPIYPLRGQIKQIMTVGAVIELISIKPPISKRLTIGFWFKYPPKLKYV